jgi:predicted glycosyltransferase
MIRELKAAHEPVITCRPLANTIELLEVHGLKYQVVGRHYGKSAIKKVLGFPLRVGQLAKCVARVRPDVAISHSSFYSPVVAKMLGIRSVYLNDNEHAAGNVVSFLCADTVMVPEFLSDASLKKQGANLAKVVRYPGVKEGIYLWQQTGLVRGEDNGRRPGSRRRVFIRAEPRTAQYYNGGTNFMDEVILGLREQVEVFVSPRDKVQTEYYAGPQFAGVRVLEKPLPLLEIAQMCDLFIGAGGTMTREAAVLGLPTVSVYQGDLLAVDRYLIEKGRMVHMPEPTAGQVTEFLNNQSSVDADSDLLAKGREAYELILDVLLGKDGVRSAKGRRPS